MSQQQAYLEAKWYAIGSKMGNAGLSLDAFTIIITPEDCRDSLAAGYDDGFMQRYGLSWTDNREES